MVIILFSTALAFVFIYFNYVNWQKKMKQIEVVKQSHSDLQVFNYSKSFVIIHAIAAVLALVFGIVSFKDGEINLAFGTALAGSFVGQIFSTLTNRQLYYNDKGFVMNGKFVRYKSIKEFVQSKRLLTTVTIVTFNKESCRMPIQPAQLIKDYREKSLVK